MKILMISFSDNADHQNTVLSMFEQLYPEYGIRAMLIKSPKIDLKRNENIILADCPPRPGICTQTFKLKALLRLVRCIKRENFDVIYFESLHIWNLPIMLAVSGSAKTYQVIHDCVPHVGDPQERGVDLMNFLVSKLASTIVLRSWRYRSDFCLKYRLDSSRVQVCELWRGWPGYNKVQSRGRMLFFGRINAYKGIESLLQIVIACPEIQFDIVGQVGDGMNAIVTKLERLPNVHLEAAYVTEDEMKSYFASAECVILPYRSASQSGVIVDAYKNSRPVIAFDVGAISSQVDDGYSGFLIPDGDTAAFAQKIRDFHALSQNEKKAMFRQAYEFGEIKYSASLARQRFLNLLGEKVESKRSDYSDNMIS